MNWPSLAGTTQCRPMTQAERDAYGRQLAAEHLARDLTASKEAKGFGFWYSEQEPTLPMPVVTDVVHTDVATRLAELQATALYVSYRGWAACRVCGCANGSWEYVHQLPDGRIFKWPEGYLHYLADHGVEPDAACLELLAGLPKETS